MEQANSFKVQIELEGGARLTHGSILPNTSLTTKRTASSTYLSIRRVWASSTLRRQAPGHRWDQGNSDRAGPSWCASPASTFNTPLLRRGSPSQPAHTTNSASPKEHTSHTAAINGCNGWRSRSAGALRGPDAPPNLHSQHSNKKPPPRRGLSDSVDLNRLLIPDQPMAGACRATGVDSAAARSRGKL